MEAGRGDGLCSVSRGNDKEKNVFDRAHVDSTGRTAAGPFNHYSQTETAVWSGGANLAAAKVALSGVAWCLALGWLDYGQGIAVWPSLALALGHPKRMQALRRQTICSLTYGRDHPHIGTGNAASMPRKRSPFQTGKRKQ